MELLLGYRLGRKTGRASHWKHVFRILHAKEYLGTSGNEGSHVSPYTTRGYEETNA